MITSKYFRLRLERGAISTPPSFSDVQVIVLTDTKMLYILYNGYF